MKVSKDKKKHTPFTTRFLVVCATGPLALGHSATANAAGPSGLGIVPGERTGLTGKYFIDKRDAVDGGIGDALGKGFYLYSDNPWHFPPATTPLTLYIGGGAAFHHYRHSNRYWEEEEENRIEGRVSYGVAYRFDMKPVCLKECAVRRTPYAGRVV